MRIEVKLPTNASAFIQDGAWTCTHKEFMPAIRQISDAVPDSPSTPNIDMARAEAVAVELSGEVATKPKAGPSDGQIY